MKLNVFKSQLPKDEMCHLRRCEHYISKSWHIELSKYAKQIIILSEIDRNIIFSKRIHASEDPFYYQRRRVNSLWRLNCKSLLFTKQSSEKISCKSFYRGQDTEKYKHTIQFARRFFNNSGSTHI